MGRQFDDEKSSRAAIGQYQFLRREYPGSRHRIDALFTIGEIYKDDLDDPAQAKVTFQEFVKKYPHSRLADQAQQAIAEINSDALEAMQDRKQVGRAAANLQWVTWFPEAGAPAPRGGSGAPPAPPGRRSGS